MSLPDRADAAWQPTVLEPLCPERRSTVRTAAFAGPARVTLRDLLTVAFHDRRRILAALLAGLALTALAALLAPSRYTAEASLLLRLGREYMYTPETGNPDQAQPISYDREQTLVAEAKILTSTDVIDRVVRTLGPATIYPALAGSGLDAAQQSQRAARQLVQGLDAELLKGSNLLQVGFTHGDAAMSARVLEQVIDAYLAKRLEVFASTTRGGAQADMAQRAAQLAEAESRLAEFKRRRGILSFAEEQSLLLAQRNALEQRLSDVTLAAAQADSRAQSLNRQIGRLPEQVRLSSETGRGEAVEAARRTLLELKLKEREARAKYFDGEPAVLDARAAVQRATEVLRELESQPPQTVRSGRSPVREGAETELVRSTADLLQSRAGGAALATQLQAVKARLAELAASEDPLRTLERERRLAEGQYEAAAKRLRDERVGAELDRQRKSNVSIVQRPQVPLEARSPRRTIVVIGLLLSVCAALLTGLLSALWRDTFLTPAEAQRALGVPMLGAVPRLAP